MIPTLWQNLHGQRGRVENAACTGEGSKEGAPQATRGSVATECDGSLSWFFSSPVGRGYINDVEGESLYRIGYVGKK